MFEPNAWTREVPILPPNEAKWYWIVLGEDYNKGEWEPRPRLLQSGMEGVYYYYYYDDYNAMRVNLSDFKGSLFSGPIEPPPMNNI